MTDTSINTGDIVSVKGVRSPKMAVIDQIPVDDETLYTLLWFDGDRCARQMPLKGQFLEVTDRDRSSFDTIPVYGMAS